MQNVGSECTECLHSSATTAWLTSPLWWPMRLAITWAWIMMIRAASVMEEAASWHPLLGNQTFHIIFLNAAVIMCLSQQPSVSPSLVSYTGCFSSVKLNIFLVLWILVDSSFVVFMFSIKLNVHGSSTYCNCPQIWQNLTCQVQYASV